MSRIGSILTKNLSAQSSVVSLPRLLPLRALQSSIPAPPPAVPFLTRGYASKKKAKGQGQAMEEEELAESASKGKKGKGKSSARESEATAVQEAFDLNALERSMGEAVDKLRVALKAIVGRVGRLSPDLLDHVKVEFEGHRSPLAEYATVSVKDGKELIVSVYDESNMKIVSEALYASPLGLTPQSASSISYRVPIARPDWEKRQTLVRQASDSCEIARTSVRSFRSAGQKHIKKDLEAKIISKEDCRNDTKKLDTSTKKRTDEVDGIFEQAKKLLMDE